MSTNYLTKRARVKLFLKDILPSSVFEDLKKTYIKLFGNLLSKNDSKVVEKHTKNFIDQYGRVVLDGPFKGMKYIDSSVGSSYFHKLAGYYEAVLHPYILELSKLPIKNILDIGAAEGYYTTGFGMMFRDASIHAFEIEEKGKKLIRELYNINDLTNKLSIIGEATNENIIDSIKENTFLLCDCEGAEKTILDIKDKEVFKNIIFGIIELHDELVPGCLEACKSYFKDTHNMEIVEFKFADVEKFLFLKNIKSKSDLSILLRERGIQDQKWMILRRK